MFIRILFLSIMIFLTTSPASAQIDRFLKGLGVGQQAGLSDAKIGSGLKEALKIGTENTVNLTGKTDGYFLNQAIKILMPEKLRNFEKGLRAVGYGPQVDEFVLSMNRAAEQAAPFAKQIFWDAIGQMSFDDAKKILSGGNTAATDYFKVKTTDKLTEAFKPVMLSSMHVSSSQWDCSAPYAAEEAFDIPVSGWFARSSQPVYHTFALQAGDNLEKHVDFVRCEG